MANFYAVKQGRKPGVYDTWAECEEQIKGFSGAKYKKFTSRKEAEIFAGLTDKKDNIDENMQPEDTKKEHNALYAYVDGSFNNKEKVAGYGLVLVQNDQVIFKDLGAFRSMEMNESKNVFGEIRGALKAVELAIANDFKEITIVYDYMGIECWAKGEWKANKVLTKDYKEFMQKYMKKIDIKFKKVKAHSGEDKYNDMADLLAKKAVGVKD
ncbi:viroplasmin family protein [Clostridium kluyveri]|uniref:Ribonuclease H n=1 Tax=Clostridium kluyveri TaxID=1534 RepID=A0A1L5FB97_CLOKL|nr:ribonuclease H family protein [Clostridium kluyveri]APM40090.1 ribonuclease H [Clostridium kluyveri]UZQ49669.1 ribonuclease H family protein [Clostridium kluyveri]